MKAVGRTGWVLLSWITLGVTTSALCAANGISENLTVRTADGTTLRFTSFAGLTGLRVDDRPLLPADRRGFSPLSICDVTTGERFVPVKAGQADVIDGTLAYRADVADLALQAAMQCQADRERITVRVSVRDTSGKDRGLLVRFALPIRAHGWRWWDDLERSRVIGKSGVYENSRRIREFAALPEWKDKPALNMAAHAVNFCNVIAGPVGLCFAVPLDQPRIFRAGYDADRQLFYIVYDVALAKETDPPGTAEFTFYLYRCDPAWGLRSALDRYYRLFPQFFTKHVRREGMWMAFSKLSEIDNVNEFRFAFQEGAPEPGYDDRLGVYSLTYFTHAGMFANIAGYNPETDPEPSYDRQLAAVREKFRKTTGRADLFDACGLHDARGRLAVKRASVYGHVLAQYNLAPDLPYGQYMLSRIPSVFQSYRERRGGELDGFYYDGITTGVNYRREHFSYANFPPTWDPVHKKPFLYNFFSSVEFARETARRLHAQGKITMMNGAMGSSFYIAPYLDVMGSETGWRIRRSDFCYLRSICRHKPFVTLLKGNFSQLTAGEIERYMRRCVAYGVFPGMFDWPPSGLGPGSRYWDHAEWYERDRLNHRKYQALCQQLASAGWEPLTLARSREPGLTLERFGRPENGEVFFTVFNDGSETVDTVVAIEPQALPPAAVVVDEISRRWLPGTPASDGRLQVPVRLEPDGLAVLHVASKQQLARSHVRQIQRNLSLRRQMREIDRDRPERLVHWRGTRYGSYDRGRLAGRSCLKLASHSAGSIRGATQWVMLYQQRPEPLRLRMRLRCDGVRPGQSGRLFVDTWLCHVNMKTRFTERKRRQFQLPTGTYEFRDVEFTIEPDRPLRSIQLFLYLWRCEGSVWVDRVSITPVDDAKCEFVVDPEFDQWYDRLPADQQRKVEARFAALEA
ncbi:MAG: hypothetical protein GXP27_13100, partial [Planctomycetes bacterium]|nr:hypothetical protein [Planctomycetota bacterium]